MKKLKLAELSSADKKLLECALIARQKAHAPYSGFKVGAALIDSTGAIHDGCNIETADYTLTSHAEMVAVDSMVKSGVLRAETIAVVLRSGNGMPVPCGLCRQKLDEFGGHNLRLICAGLTDDDEIESIFEFALGELLPHSFSALNFE